MIASAHPFEAIYVEPVVKQGREASMGTPALSREKSDLARRSVAMITKEAVGSPKVPILLQPPKKTPLAGLGQMFLC